MAAQTMDTGSTEYPFTENIEIMVSPVHTKAISQKCAPSVLRQTLVSHELLAGLLCFLGAAISAPHLAADEPQVLTPNFRQAEQYNSAYLRQFVYSTSVSPNWIDKTDEFWYSFKSSDGTKYWRTGRKPQLPPFVLRSFRRWRFENA